MMYHIILMLMFLKYTFNNVSLLAFNFHIFTEEEMHVNPMGGGRGEFTLIFNLYYLINRFCTNVNRQK